MDTQYIIPFVNSIKNVFSTMLQTEVSFEKPYLKEQRSSAHDVSGIISFTGAIKGSIIVNLPTQLAVDLIKRFIGAAVDPNHPDFADAVGELVNMVAGGAKAQLNQDNVQISCPSVVIGEQHQILQQKGHPIVVIPCRCDAGPFLTEIALLKEASASAGGKSAAA